MGILGHTNAPDALNGAAIGFAWKYTKEMEDAESGDSLHQGKDSIILRDGMLYQYRMIDAIGKSGNDITTKGSRRALSRTERLMWCRPFQSISRMSLSFCTENFKVNARDVILVIQAY